MAEPFRDRTDAGRQLAARLERYATAPGLIVLALPRGGVPVAFEVAAAINAPLDVLLVRKLGVPGHEELAMGAIAAGGVRVVNRSVVEGIGISEDTLNRVADREAAELRRRDALYRDGRPHPDLRGRTVILVDDGLATGSTMRAAVDAVRTQAPRAVVVAVPVAAPASCAEFRQLADDCVVVLQPETFRAVGAWYEDFTQTTDAEVRRLLGQAGTTRPEPSGTEDR